MLIGRILTPCRMFLAVVAMCVMPQSGLAQASAAAGPNAVNAANYTRLCSACHTIGGGRRVGPDLKGISERRSQDWLVKWIAASQAMVRSGDPAAVALFDEYKVPMPDTQLSTDEIRGLLDYIKAGDGAAPAEPAVRAASPEDIRRGRELFQGGASLKNGGPACASCHHVAHDNVIGGGVLAKELTGAFTRLGAAGIQAILQAAPFPVMQQAYSGKAIAEDEAVAIGGYLKSVAEAKQVFDQPREDSLKLLFGGLGGLTVLMGLYSFTWRRRKKSLVNQKVFDRQVRSE